MNSILIISDSHGWEKQLQDIRKNQSHVKEAIHCGDSELNEESPFLKDYQVVKGNCDWTADFPNEIIFEYGGLTFLITHGHLFDIKSSLMKLEYRAQEVGADIICFGHSHVAYAENINGRLFINPGSIRLPRQFPEGSYAKLNWTSSEDIQLEFFNIEGEEITNLPYRNKFSLK